jgi:hypothetical protein
VTDDGLYSGMTINERLYAASLLDAFDDAMSRRDRDEMIRILAILEVPNP